MRGAPFALGRLSALSIAATLFLAACGGGGAQPTAAPAAQPTTAKPTTAPAAAPSAAPAASPAAAASPSAKPAASPAASPAAVAAAPSPSAAPAAASQLSGTIKIVSSLPRTGSNKGQTDTLINSFKMALDEAGGTDGVGAKVDSVESEVEDIGVELGHLMHYLMENKQ